MRWWSLPTLLASLFAQAGCGLHDGGGGVAASSPSRSLQPGAVARALTARPYRLGVVFWPSFDGCGVCDSRLAEELGRWEAEAVSAGEVRVVSVLPRAAADEAGGPPWPGELVRLGGEEYARFRAISPLPRIEIWSGSGELLLVRGVANYPSELAVLREELLVARSFTKPMPAPAAGE